MKASERRIVVTGVGAISALGGNVPAIWNACRTGQSGVETVTLDGGPHGPPAQAWPVALVKGDPVAELEAALGRRVGGSLDPFAVFGLKAAHEALAAAGLLGSEALKQRSGVIFGHGIGGLTTLERAYERFFGLKSAKVHPLTVPRVMVSAPASAISMEFGIAGPVFAISSACSSSGHAMVQGAQMIASGRVDVAVVGGSEAIATAASLSCWDGIQATTRSACRPFSIGRDGMVIGEGAAAMVLESLDHARARGAEILAELSGTGMSSDAFHWTQPNLAGAVACMREACEAAGALDAEALLISAHGTGTPLNDKNEAEAINALFGDRASGHRVIATKSSHGHLIGASTALQAVVGLLALRDGIAPPILNFVAADPDCDLNLVVGEAQSITSERLLVNSFAFGGLNTSLVFESSRRL